MVARRQEVQSKSNVQYRAWEGLVRAAYNSARVQPDDVVRGVTVSHRTDELSHEEFDAIIGLARGLASDAHLEVDFEEMPGRLVVRFCKPQATGSEGRSFGEEIRAFWHRVVWQRRE